MRVLLVANSKTIIRRFRQAFKDSEHEFVVSETTKGALLKTMRWRFDVVICTSMGMYNNDYKLATDLHGTATKVLIVDDRRKYSAIPFLNIRELSMGRILQTIERIFEGGE